MQFSLFGAAAADLSLDDLAGVVLAGGQWVRSGEQVRLSVVVGDPWRAQALAEVFAELGLGGDVTPSSERLAVRTDFTARLEAPAQSWIRGAAMRLPAGFTLTAGGLRLWAICSGRADAGGYLLATADPEHFAHKAAGAQLARLGLAATVISVRGGTGWRVTSAKRLRRLAELLGEPPAGAGLDWPIA